MDLLLLILINLNSAKMAVSCLLLYNCGSGNRCARFKNFYGLN